MAKKKKKNITGEINFYKAMAVLGVLLAGVLIYQFFGSAPPLTTRQFHDPQAPAGKCLACHTGQASNIPIMPHRRMDACTFCHTPEGTG